MQRQNTKVHSWNICQCFDSEIFILIRQFYSGRFKYKSKRDIFGHFIPRNTAMINTFLSLSISLES